MKSELPTPVLYPESYESGEFLYTGGGNSNSDTLNDMLWFFCSKKEEKERFHMKTIFSQSHAILAMRIIGLKIFT